MSMSSDSAASTSMRTPSAASASEDGLVTERAVRFDQECVLIPEPASKSRRPRLVMKSYSLPLWNRKTSSGSSAVSDSDIESNEEGPVLFRVTVPKIISKKSSFTRDREEAPPSPLSPCLVHREPGSPRSPRPVRRCSVPLSPRPDLVTIPLRACCPDCIHTTEESLKEGAEWKERFTRGARRRRNSSCSSDEGSGARYGESVRSSLERRVLSVDEVDKRRRSSGSGDEHDHHRGRECIINLNDESPHLSRSPGSPNDPPCLGVSTVGLSPSIPRASPIPEEDEDQLFPLPSPRRSPSASPTGSTSCLTTMKDDVDPTARSPTRESSSESITCASPKSPAPFTSKKCEKGFLAPDPSLWLPSPAVDSPTTLSSSPPGSPGLTADVDSTPPHPPASQPISIPPSLSRREAPQPSESPILENPVPSRREASTSSAVSATSMESEGVSPRSASPETRRRRRSSLQQLHMAIPGLLRASADVLRGVTAISGTPMST
ncbi:hypothetical protein GLOTRDRAFT_119138 [Gloeophyllum trabeum ATCC 11539]|uniref:Uncharacterized protein n=1 Tax=Gloeophyllum trabeum (strain ATCC 11539 / FP-39264 / Madison 617) TaxID=670483 RepID=S7QNU6_GLOTA|nr:uncharacterized protein GLOTRDRAFT_119138 [Gloeophyllum trabeum ATCC 11539]EPQ61241.1 hypothetical protein GLOTRDRAFT_119138 [Gloeophyllum trabeum ATCC 11539]